MFRRGLAFASNVKTATIKRRYDRIVMIVIGLANSLYATGNDTYMATVLIPALELQRWDINEGDVLKIVLKEALDEHLPDDWGFSISFAEQVSNLQTIQLKLQKTVAKALPTEDLTDTTISKLEP